MEWTRKQKKAYNRVLSGFYLASVNEDNVRFMTLTTADGVDEYIKVGKRNIKRLKYDFDLLVKSIRSEIGGDGIEYCRIETIEGNGVYHVVCKGEYIDLDWLEYKWHLYHGSPIVDISLVEDYKKNACYVVSQYMGDQGGAFVDSSYSRNCVYPKFEFYFRFLKKFFDLYDAIDLWHMHLSGDILYFEYNDSVYFNLDSALPFPSLLMNYKGNEVIVGKSDLGYFGWLSYD